MELNSLKLVEVSGKLVEKLSGDNSKDELSRNFSQVSVKLLFLQMSVVWELMLQD